MFSSIARGGGANVDSINMLDVPDVPIIELRKRDDSAVILIQGEDELGFIEPKLPRDGKVYPALSTRPIGADQSCTVK